MTLKNRILEKLKQRPYNLQELYVLFPEHSPASIRGTINKLVKKGIVVRTGKGTYVHRNIQILIEALERFASNPEIKNPKLNSSDSRKKDDWDPAYG